MNEFDLPDEAYVVLQKIAQHNDETGQSLMGGLTREEREWLSHLRKKEMLQVSYDIHSPDGNRYTVNGLGRIALRQGTKEPATSPTLLPLPSRQVGGVHPTAITQRVHDPLSHEELKKHTELLEQIADKQPPPAPLAPQYVIRDQMAAIVGKSKDTIENWFKEDADAPEPAIEGGGGKPHQYIWSKVRPWLEKMSSRILPERYPSQLPPG